MGSFTSTTTKQAQVRRIEAKAMQQLDSSCSIQSGLTREHHGQDSEIVEGFVCCQDANVSIKYFGSHDKLPETYAAEHQALFYPELTERLQCSGWPLRAVLTTCTFLQVSKADFLGTMGRNGKQRHCRTYSAAVSVPCFIIIALAKMPSLSAKQPTMCSGAQSRCHFPAASSELS